MTPKLSALTHLQHDTMDAPLQLMPPNNRLYVTIANAFEISIVTARESQLGAGGHGDRT